MKKIIPFLVFLSFLSCVSYNYTAYDDVTLKESFTVKQAEAEKAWSRAHSMIYQLGTYEYIRNNKYTITSEDFSGKLRLGITREFVGSDARFTIILTGEMSKKCRRDIISHKVRERNRCLKLRTMEVEAIISWMKKYMLTGNKEDPDVQKLFSRKFF